MMSVGLKRSSGARSIPSSGEDAGLVQAARRGDHGAFTELVERYKCLVCSVAYDVTGSLTKSEEIGQEAFVFAWAELGELREPHRFRNWICGIARNIGFRVQREERRRPLAEPRLERRSRDIASAEPSPL